MTTNPCASASTARGMSSACAAAQVVGSQGAAPPARGACRPRLRRLGKLTALLTGALLSGCSIGVTWPGPTRSETDFAAIQPGMSGQEVIARVGPPTWTFGVRQENLTIWNYRHNPLDCVIYQVSVRPDGTVRDAGTGWDPACDNPAGRWR